MEVKEAIGIVKSVLTALDYAHRHGIVHCDVKPSNVLVDHQGWVWLSDFGTAIAMGEQRRTPTGVTVGTLSYMSPEEIAHPRSIDHRSDVYSVGCLLYELVTGRPPFVKNQDGVGNTNLALAQAHVRQQPVRPSHRIRGVPADLDEIIMLALAKAPDDRLPGCQEFVRLLDQVRTWRSADAPASAGAARHGSGDPASLVGKLIDVTARAARRVIDLIRPTVSEAPSPPSSRENHDESTGEMGMPLPLPAEPAEPATAEPATAEPATAEPVLLAVGAPRGAGPGSSFNARFAAYVAAAKGSAQHHLEAL